ncbi:transporter substrate-binding domain-containing protein [Pectobacterium cacticida]|uniref:transporter substrate-binding domain-containing protein n=1 Tax=Pectobacterium cacticida TaxID=69221 RepID=UPI002FF1FC88
MKQFNPFNHSLASSKKLRWLYAIAATGLGLFGSIQNASANTLPPLPDYIAQQGKLRVGVKCDYPPAGFLGSDGKPTGVEVDMARHIAQIAFGSPDKIDLQCVTSENRIPTLMAKKVDLLLATLGIFPARQKVIDFTVPYFWGSSTFLVAKNSPYQTNAEVLDKKIIVLKGGSQITWLTKNAPKAQLIRMNTNSDALQSLRQGRGDAYTGDVASLINLLPSNPELRMLPLKEQYDVQWGGGGIRKGEPEWKAYLDVILQDMKTQHFYGPVVDKYVKESVVRDLMVATYETDPPQK